MLTPLMRQYNNRVHSVTGFAPSILMLGQLAKYPCSLEKIDKLDCSKYDKQKWVDSGISELHKQIRIAALRSLKKRQEDINKWNLNKADQIKKASLLIKKEVMLQTNRQTNLDKGEHEKLLPSWKGPYIVTEFLNKDSSCILTDPNGNKKTAPIARLKLYKRRPEWMETHGLP